MTTGQIISELRGKVAGENRQQTKQMFATWEGEPEVKIPNRMAIENGQQFFAAPKLHVVMENGQYALLLEYSVASEFDTRFYNKALKEELNSIRKLQYDDYVNAIKLFDSKVRKLQEVKKNYYIAGINDEGLYFVRPLEGIPEHITRDFDKIISWLNKEDWGYTRRIQGDILIQFIPFAVRTGWFKKTKNREMEDSYISYYLKERTYRLSKNESNKEYTDSICPYGSRLAMNLPSGKRAWDDAEKDRELTFNFGDHIISTYLRDDCLALPNSSGFFATEPLVIDAPRFTMTHPEHGRLEVKVPEGHYAVLASQRGRAPIALHGTFD